MIRYQSDGVGFEVKEPHDFSWLNRFGRVFCAFDSLISGNLCFGVSDGRQKFFIKYAGAATKMYNGRPENAVRHLMKATPKYEDLKHPSVIPLLAQTALPQGHALVFPWFEGYALAPIDLHLKKLQALRLIDRLRMYDSLADAIVNANQKDYLAAGLAHQQILVNFDQALAVICSLNHFRRFPAIAPHPKLPGSAWFVPPEGYRTGAPLDERSNVYALGALAFTFFGNPRDQSGHLWSAGSALYQIAQQAISPDIGKRPQSPALYQKMWRETVFKMNRLSGV